MINYKQTARIVGIIFLAGMLAGIPGNIMVQSLTAGPDYLQALSAQHMTLAIGAMLMLSTAIGDATHGTLMYPILKKHQGQLAAGYFGFRIINATFLALQVLFIVLQVPIAEAYSGSALPDPPIWQALSHLCIKANLLSYQLAMIFLGIAGVLLCYVLYKTQLLSRGLALWGLFGYVTMFVGSILEVIGIDLQFMHTIPGGLWEIFIGFWLIFKGFNVPIFDEKVDCSL
jgi:hypothetical protein